MDVAAFSGVDGSVCVSLDKMWCSQMSRSVAGVGFCLWSALME